MKVYLIPGLGYDRKIFSRLKIDSDEIVFIDWIKPKKNELIQDYARRLFNLALNDSSPCVIIGHSFGGMMAQEIAAISPVKKVILISSVKSRAEIPRYFKIIKPLMIHKLFSKELSLKTVKYWGKDHGFVSASEQELFKSMLAHQTNSYLRWALKNLSVWQTPEVPKTTKLVHIHGTKDKTLLFSKIVAPDHIINNGSHIMLYHQAELISQLINSELI